MPRQDNGMRYVIGWRFCVTKIRTPKLYPLLFYFSRKRKHISFRRHRLIKPFHLNSIPVWEYLPIFAWSLDRSSSYLQKLSCLPIKREILRVRWDRLRTIRTIASIGLGVIPSPQSWVPLLLEPLCCRLLNLLWLHPIVWKIASRIAWLLPQKWVQVSEKEHWQHHYRIVGFISKQSSFSLFSSFTRFPFHTTGQRVLHRFVYRILRSRGSNRRIEWQRECSKWRSWYLRWYFWAGNCCQGRR